MTDKPEKETKAPKSTEAKKAPAKKAAAPAAAKEVSVEKKKAPRAATAKKAEGAEAAPKATEAKAAPRRSGRVQGIADVAAAMGSTKAAATQAPAKVKSHIDAQGRAYATGRRKDAVAKVWLKPGTGRIIVNGRAQEVYFARPVLRMLISQPFAVANRIGQYDIMATVLGGGLSGQAGALRHGLSRALTYIEPDLRSVLKKAGCLTRDSRVVERKKFGQPKARRQFQFSKR